MRKPLCLLLALCCAALPACGAARGSTTQPPTSAATQPEEPQASSVPDISESEAESMPMETSEARTGQQARPAPEDQLEEVLTGTAEPLPTDVIARMVGSSWNEGAPVPLEDLRYLRIPIVDFAGEAQLGEMVVHESVADEVLEIFAELYEIGYPIEKMVLIDDYAADDLASMAANNSSGFCSRLVLGTDRWSVHSYGRAVDINPVQNPYVVGSNVYPEAAEAYMDRADVRPGMVVEGDACYNAFVSRGWSWGGHWQNPDYQHFEKN